MKQRSVRLARGWVVNVLVRVALNSVMLGVFAVVSLQPARAVVIEHLSMQKLAVISDAVVLCEEFELRDNVIEYPNVTLRTVQARCRTLRLFKGALEPEKEFIANYGYTRRPHRKGSQTVDAGGLVISKSPSKYFPAGRALLFLSNTKEAGVYAVVGAKLIQNDEVFDLGGDLTWTNELIAEQQPENSPLGECLKYGEAELVADYLKGMEQLANPALSQQYRVPFHEDPFARSNWGIQVIALTLSLISALLMYAVYKACRSRMPKFRMDRAFLGGCLAVVAAGVLGVHVYAITTIWGQRPVRWAQVRTGMTSSNLRCFVKSYERYAGYDYSGGPHGREQVMTKQIEGLFHGTWLLTLHYDVNGKVEDAMIHYRGKFSQFVPSIRLD